MKKELIIWVTILSVFFVFCASFAKAQSFSEEIAAIADVVVDINGSGDYLTVQEAINSIPDSNETTKIIFVKNIRVYCFHHIVCNCIFIPIINCIWYKVVQVA